MGQEKRALMITNSNQVNFAKVLGREVQEVLLDKASKTEVIKRSLSKYYPYFFKALTRIHRLAYQGLIPLSLLSLSRSIPFRSLPTSK